AERDQRDDQLGGVAECGVQKAAPGGTGTPCQLFGAEADQAGERYQRQSGRDEHPGRRGRQHPERPRYGRGGQQEVEAVVEERATHHSPNASTSSSAAPGRRSKNASRLRSSERRNCGIVPSNVCSVRPAFEPSASLSVPSSTPLSVPSGMSRTP